MEELEGEAGPCLRMSMLSCQSIIVNNASMYLGS